MAGPVEPQTVKALDGTIEVLGNGNATSKEQGMSSQLKINGEGSEHALPSSGNALTGKQEHCTPGAMGMYRAYTKLLQISRESYFRSKSTLKLQNLLLLQHYNVSGLLSAPTMAKLPQSIQISQFCASSSSITSATFPSSTKQEKRSFGRISFKW